MLNEDCPTDVAQDLAAPAGGAAPHGEGAGERFDHIKHGGHLPLVPRQRGALGQGVGDYEKTLGRRRADVDRPARRDLVVLVGRQLDCGRFLLMAGELAVDALPKRAQDLVLLERRQADQHYDAVTEHGQEALGAGRKVRGAADSTSERSKPAISMRSPIRSARPLRRAPVGRALEVSSGMAGASAVAGFGLRSSLVGMARALPAFPLGKAGHCPAP